MWVGNTHPQYPHLAFGLHHERGVSDAERYGAGAADGSGVTNVLREHPPHVYRTRQTDRYPERHIGEGKQGTWSAAETVAALVRKGREVRIEADDKEREEFGLDLGWEAFPSGRVTEHVVSMVYPDLREEEILFGPAPQVQIDPPAQVPASWVS